MQTITLIGTLPPIKGLSPYILQLSQAMAKQVKIDFIGFKRLYPERLYPGGTVDTSTIKPSIPNLHNRSFLTWYNPLTWLWAGLTCKGELVHAQWWSHILAPIYFTILLIAKLRGKKIIVTVHNVKPHENNRIARLLNGSIFVFADRFIVHSEYNKAIFCKETGYAHEKVAVIPHGIIAPQLSAICHTKMGLLQNDDFKETRKRATQSYQEVRRGANDEVDTERAVCNSPIILFFGTIRPYKGVDVLIKAFKQINIQDARLIIAGKCWENPQKYLELIANDPSIDFVNRYIPDSELETLFQKATCVVLPYLEFESASGVTGLALYFQKPIIASKVGSLPETIIDKEHCLVSPGNIEELAEKLKIILEDVSLQQKLSTQSAKLAERFEWKTIAEQTVSNYSYH